MTLLQSLAAMDATTLAAFVSAGLLLNLTPGADVMYVTANALQGGPRRGIAASLGIALGVLTHIALATLGLAALIAANPALFEIIRWAGIAYLLWLAYQAWTAAPAGAGTPSRYAVFKGWLTNILNPKVALFILAFLPQFATPGAGPVWQQVLVLGLIFASVGTLVSIGYALLAGSLAHRLHRHQTAMNRIAGTLLAALAARMATQ